MARAFSGSSEFLETATAAVSSSPLTMSCWFYPTNIVTDRALVTLGSETESDLIYLWSEGSQSSVSVAYFNDGGYEIARSTSGPSLSTWHHALGTIDSDDLATIYLDGGNLDTEDLSSVVPTAIDSTQIGAYTYSGGHGDYFAGNIAEVAIWNIDLTAAEAAIAAVGCSPLLIRPQNLVLYVPMVRDNDKDIIGGLSFTANGTPTVAPHPRVIYPVPSTIGGITRIPTNVPHPPIVYLAPPIFYMGEAGTPTSDSTDAYLKGQDSDTDSQHAYLEGTTGTDVDDSQLAFLAGGLNVLDSVDVYLDGMGERLTPDGDISQSGSWQREDTSPSNLYQSIDEYPAGNDADYVWHDDAQSGKYFEVSLSDPEDPQIGEGEVKVFWRIKRRAGSQTMTLKVELREGATIIASDSKVLTDTDTTYTYTLTSGEKSSITNWSNLRLRFIVESVV